VSGGDYIVVYLGIIFILVKNFGNMKKEDLTYDKVKRAVEKAGFKFFVGPYNVNMVGIRSLNRKVDGWDDFFCLLYLDEDGKKVLWVNDQFTTDPGIYYMQNKLLNPAGCGILARGQYRGVWKIGKHGRAQYEAFVQIGNKVKLYRDRNKDNIMDFDVKSVQEGYFGVNQHHGYDSVKVGPNSAACQVHRFKKDLAYVLSIAKKNTAMGNGDSFTYTLLEEGKDF
jgi:hypothetical protein